jgi:hypothetical protein
MELHLRRKRPGDDDDDYLPGPSKRHNDAWSEDEGYDENNAEDGSDEEDTSLVDDGSDDENASTVDDTPYDEDTEAFPHCAAFDQALQTLEEETVSLAKKLRKTLEQHASVSESLQNMKVKIDEAVEPPEPERLMIVMVGATGAGKISQDSFPCPKLKVCHRKELAAQRGHRHAATCESGMTTEAN